MNDQDKIPPWRKVVLTPRSEVEAASSSTAPARPPQDCPRTFVGNIKNADYLDAAADARQNEDQVVKDLADCYRHQKRERRKRAALQVKKWKKRLNLMLYWKKFYQIKKFLF